MPNDQSVYADADRIYLATFTTTSPPGRLYVLARDRAADFPTIEAIDFPTELTAVRGDATHLYVGGTDGTLYVYRKTRPLTRVAAVPIVSYGLRGLQVVRDRIYVAAGQTHVAADESHVYLAALNEGDVVIEIIKGTWARGHTYGSAFESSVTVVYDRRTGARITALPNATTAGGDSSTSVLYVDRDVLGQLQNGCCGIGVRLSAPRTFEFDEHVPHTHANTVARRGRWLVVGDEAGFVAVWDIGLRRAQRVASVDLRSLTGHTGIEDIEIRALWFDEVDNLLFAGSSWGNDQSRSAALPAFFVLKLSTTEPTVSVADEAVTEGDAGTTEVRVTATLSAPSNTTVTVDVETSNGTAKNADFGAAKRRLTFPPGTVRRRFTVTVNGDTLDEPDERFYVTLTNPWNAKLGRERARVTIADDD